MKLHYAPATPVSSIWRDIPCRVLVWSRKNVLAETDRGLVVVPRRNIRRTKMKAKHCYGCKHLYSTCDSAGGGLYHCKQSSPGLIIGEYGHWTDESDKPKPLHDDCWDGEGKPDEH